MAGQRAYLRGLSNGGVPEWLKGTDCKSVGGSLRWFESNPLQGYAPVRQRSLSWAAEQAPVNRDAFSGAQV